MTADHELLELAAKAAGMLPLPDGKELDYSRDGGLMFCGGGECTIWNPLDDDGDALRLAVRLTLSICTENAATLGEVYCTRGRVFGNYEIFPSSRDDDGEAAARRAIVLAAAEIGRSML
jgi:hypothetical protein